MWINNNFIVPSAVVAVVPRGRAGSKGCTIWLNSGGVIETLLPTTQVVATLGL